MRAHVVSLVALIACRDPSTSTSTSTSTSPSPSPSPSPSSSPSPSPSTPFVPSASSGPWGIARTPSSITPAPRPAIVYLHGMWASPEDSCSFFDSAAAPHGFLICPRGNAPRSAGGAWNGDYAAVAPQLRAAFDAADALAPDVLDRAHGGTLIGFSIGATYAVKVALAEEGRWSGLVLMSMSLALDADRLKRAGIKRIVFAAGDFDGSHGSMERAARAMSAAGIESRYMSLGPVGHSFAKDMPAKMADAIAWVRSQAE